MFSRVTIGQGVSRLVDELLGYLVVHGTINKPKTVSGRPTSQQVRSIDNVVFKVAQPIDQAHMNKMIVHAHGLEGLRFLLIEGAEWFEEHYVNPGEAWKEDPARWEGLLNDVNEMDYTYNSRLHTYNAIENVIEELRCNPGSRRAYLPVFFAVDTPSITLGVAIPCIIGYHFTIDDNRRINLSVLVRSCDIVNCLRNDIWLAHNLLKYMVANVRGTEVGDITFHIMNLHAYDSIK